MNEASGFAASALLHIGVIFLLSYSFSFGVREEFFDIPPVISVDVVAIGQETVIKTPPRKEPKKEAPAPPPKPPETKKIAAQPEKAPTPPKPETPPKPAKKAEPAKQLAAKPEKPKKPKQKPKPKIDEQAALQDLAQFIDRSKQPAKTAAQAEQDFFSAFGKGKPAQVADSRSKSLSLIDAARNQVQRCWAPPLGARDAASMRVSVSVLLGPDGGVIGTPTLDASDQRRMRRSSETVFRTFAESAIRAVQKCAPYDLPKARYSEWRTLRLNFDPSQMIN
ncbi:MAG: hypothetical protein AAF607_01285 [Pseudomonadota bacterium]